jgi:hypothetical protein
MKNKILEQYCFNLLIKHNNLLLDWYNYSDRRLLSINIALKLTEISNNKILFYVNNHILKIQLYNEIEKYDKTNYICKINDKFSFKNNSEINIIENFKEIEKMNNSYNYIILNDCYFKLLHHKIFNIFYKNKNSKILAFFDKETIIFIKSYINNCYVDYLGDIDNKIRIIKINRIKELICQNLN